MQMVETYNDSIQDHLKSQMMFLVYLDEDVTYFVLGMVRKLGGKMEQPLEPGGMLKEIHFLLGKLA